MSTHTTKTEQANVLYDRAINNYKSGKQYDYHKKNAVQSTVIVNRKALVNNDKEHMCSKRTSWHHKAETHNRNVSRTCCSGSHFYPNNICWTKEKWETNCMPCFGWAEIYLTELVIKISQN